MSFSILYSAIVRGKWMIDFRQVDTHRSLVNELVTRELNSNEKPTTLSERKPLMAYVGTEKSMAYNNSFSEAPKGSTAIIPLQGTMLKNGTYCSYGTQEIAELINEATVSENIDCIVLNIDSGGGSVDAIAPLVQSILNAQSKSKPVVACCDLCASAAYFAACYCDEIIASNNISAEFGSIGVMLSFRDYAEFYKNEGIKEHNIYSNHSDYKNAAFDAARKGEYGKIKTEELDPLAIKFQESVKQQRGSRLNQSIEGILSGRMFFAEDAQKNGLIDNIGTLTTAVQRAKEIRREACIQEYINSKS